MTIIGEDFLCAPLLLVDVANRYLIDAESFSSLPCFTWGTKPIVRANFVALGNVFNVCFLSFPHYLLSQTL